MPPSLPPEILDSIVDHLRGDPATLKTCCLVSKSWIHRTREHLFANVGFFATYHRVELWVEAFPDPTNSPAHHTRTLSIHHPHLIKATHAGTISSFCGVVRLVVNTETWDNESLTLVSLHGLSPVLRSLQLIFTALPDSEIFGLICSLPLLEDLKLLSTGNEHRDGRWTTPSTSPRLTGSLELFIASEEIQPTTRRLLDLPNGLHFTKLIMAWFSEQDVTLTTDLVSRCSGTVQSLEVTSYFSGTFPSVLYKNCNSQLRPDVSGMTELDLSEVTQLRDVSFRFTRPNVKWISKALHTARSGNLQRISLEPPRHRNLAVGAAAWERVHQEWVELDQLLVQFWASHSLRPRVTYEPGRFGEEMRVYVAGLLPELTRRGIIDLVQCPP